MNRLLPPDFKGEKYGLCYRFVNEDDAEFIVRLRTNPKLGRFINSTDNDVEKQRQWIRDYKVREDSGLDYYFIFGLKDGTMLGVSRIYCITDKSFDTGSWVFDPGAPFGAAFLGNMITHEMAYDLFPDKVHLHDIKKSNKNVLRYAKQFNPKVISETEDSFRFQDDRDNFYEAEKAILRKILPVFKKFSGQ